MTRCVSKVAALLVCIAKTASMSPGQPLLVSSDFACFDSNRITAIVYCSQDIQRFANDDDSCALHVLDEYLSNFNLGFAFRHDFPFNAFKANVSAQLDSFMTSGILKQLEEAWTGKARSQCQGRTYSETNRVGIYALWGLWIMLGAAIVLALVTAAVQYSIRRKEPEKREITQERWSELISSFRARNLSLRLRDASTSSRTSSAGRPSTATRQTFAHCGKACSIALLGPHPPWLADMCQ
jgi:hypothetical protein